MSSLAFPRKAARGRVRSLSLADLVAVRGSDVLLVVAMLALATALLTFTPSAFSVDSWLALVAGRDVWQLGIPHHETLTSIAHGVPWVDQQWLSQVAMYALYRAGGLGLVGLINYALMMLGIGGAVVGARRLGAPARSVMLALPLCLWLMLPSREVRTQEFVIPLFVATAYLLAQDSRAPSRRVYRCLPILVLWGNLHGSAALGAMLIALRGLTVAWERRASLAHSLHAWRRPLALALGAPLCLLLTPYGLGIVGYYQTMFVSSPLKTIVTEWQPITSAAAIAIPFFVCAAVAVWSFGRNASRTTLWERLALLALAAGSIQVIRNVLFFALFALLVLPVSLELRARATDRPISPRSVRINSLLSLAALAALTIAIAATLLRPASTVELSYQRLPVLQAVEQQTRADPSLKVFADVRFADWLLWRDPALRGKIANDARFELLTADQMDQLKRVMGVVGPNWKQGVRGYRLLVLDKEYDPSAAQAFLAEPGRRVLYDDGERLVILRSASEAG